MASVAPPAMKPLYQTRATADVLLDVARKLKQPLGLPWQTFDEMLAAQSPGFRRRRLPATRSRAAEWGRAAGTLRRAPPSHGRDRG